ncbi:MAG: hypothetical protein ACR2ID_07510 [Chthoniobacterales bacterium]
MDAPNAARPERRVGCFAKGCLSFAGLAVFLAIAFVGGGIWAMRHFRDKYSDPEPSRLPAAVVEETIDPSTPASTPVQAVPPPGTRTDPPESAPVVKASPAGVVADTRPVQARWKSFEKAAHRNEQAHIELTAGDINILLNDDPKIRGKAFVSIDNNVGHVQVSVPLDRVFMMGGRYLNGTATVEASPDGDPGKVRISNVVLGSSAVSEEVLDKSWFGSASIRSFVTKWLEERNVGTFNIKNNVVIGETRAE